jgi:hypothetical protein
MTKKHFIAFADAISMIDDGDQRHAVAHLIGVVCARFNDSFDWDRWFVACGVER